MSSSQSSPPSSLGSQIPGSLGSQRSSQKSTSSGTSQQSLLSLKSSISSGSSRAAKRTQRVTPKTGPFAGVKYPQLDFQRQLHRPLILSQEDTPALPQFSRPPSPKSASFHSRSSAVSWPPRIVKSQSSSLTTGRLSASLNLRTAPSGCFPVSPLSGHPPLKHLARPPTDGGTTPPSSNTPSTATPVSDPPLYQFVLADSSSASSDSPVGSQHFSSPPVGRVLPQFPSSPTTLHGAVVAGGAITAFTPSSTFSQDSSTFSSFPQELAHDPLLNAPVQLALSPPSEDEGDELVNVTDASITPLDSTMGLSQGVDVLSVSTPELRMALLPPRNTPMMFRMLGTTTTFPVPPVATAITPSADIDTESSDSSSAAATGTFRSLKEE